MPAIISPAYQDALDYLFSFVDFSKTHMVNLAPENFNLARMFDLLARIGNPHHSYHVIHVAGTKGKGSVSALCAAALHASGLKTGLNTSPHLQDFSERIQVNGMPISQDTFVRLINDLKPHVALVEGLSTFEIGTALAMLYFAEEEVDVAVLEVGLGGRLDATNVVTPLVSVITSISLDHVPVLGTTLPEIAREKGGIIKPGVPVVLAPQKPEVTGVLQNIAARRDAPLTQVGTGLDFSPGPSSLDGQSVIIRETGQELTLQIPLLGQHQVENAAVAYAALKKAMQLGLPVTAEGIRTGFARVNWPGRFEIISRRPFIILDAAHNQDSAQKLRRTIDNYFPGTPIVILFGFSGDKAVSTFLQELAPRAVRIFASRSTHPRAMQPEDIAALAAEIGIEAEPFDRIEEALAQARSATPAHGALLITGSVFIAGAAREILLSPP